ncbi:type VII secretion integral membrane protein EccD [Candidatus Mycolicibacterium alkanivorans]|uniref:Type VII secretion integral membrane protein EccD n=1 Tax=Candidatus Mycolicibacterium alkanivorans TaxID=2954114 RepID=A0ABS9YTR0_9MYCO|nr:type VII secretion integral membrane protein EccD [Candidatus Mycolicibacterium alkanivorans]MCI4674193.1 type VII secretion integral membrane protein EccD [Candidatus Mycolicibacterium alkanivorans]
MPTVFFPARCAIAVICGEHLVSQVYPASVPVEVFIDNIVELLNEELKRRGVAGLDPGIAYELNRANGTRLDVTKTLDELGVEDGATLVLVPAQEGESFEPQYESLSTGLARIGKRLFAPVTAQTAVHTAMAVLTMVALTILGLAVHARLHSDSPAPVVVTGVGGLLLGLGTIAVWRWWPGRTDLLNGLGWLTVPLLAVAFAAAAPGGVGAAHLFIAALATAVLTCGVVAITQRHVAVAATVVTLCVIGGLVAAARMWRPVPAQWLGMLTLIGLLLLLTLGPTFALRAARIRPPHFGSITGRDLFRRGDGLPVDTVSPVDEDAEDEPNPDTTPRGAAITEAAKRANGVLTGICVAAALALPPAVWATLIPGRGKSTAASVLAGLFVLIFTSRGRAFADRRQAVALVGGAAGAFCAAVIRYVVAAPADSGAALLWGALVLVAFAGVGLTAALLVPVTRFTPLVRMLAEWLELVAIVAAFPLAAWIGGLFSWVRMR